MSHFEELFMNRAIELATNAIAHCNGGPFGAVVVKNGAIVGEGFNRVTANNDPTAHAEIMAIRDACSRLGTFQLDDCVIYTSCEPCPMCLGAIYWSRPRAVYYACNRSDAANAGFDDEFIYSELPKKGEERTIPFIGVPSDKAQKVFDLWIGKKDKTAY